MYSLSLTLPDDKERVRLLGKENRKLKDNRTCGRGFSQIDKGLIVQIRAHTKDALRIAEEMVLKSINIEEQLK